MTRTALATFLSVTHGAREPSRRLFEVHDSDIVASSKLVCELDDLSFREAVALWAETDGDKACVARFVIDAHAETPPPVGAEAEKAAMKLKDYLISRRQALSSAADASARYPNSLSWKRRVETVAKEIADIDPDWR